nr:hypothetical protein [Tanacetum cinerariifolium]
FQGLVCCWELMGKVVGIMWSSGGVVRSGGDGAPMVKVCAGKCGLRSWEWCGGGGVECRVGERCSRGEILCWRMWVEFVGVVWRWWSGAGSGEEVGMVLAGKTGRVLQW